MGLAEKRPHTASEHPSSEYAGTVFEQGVNGGHLTLYNSRIACAYVGYLQKHHPAIDIDDLLRYAEISPPELEDPAHWFNQRQVDRFQTILVKKTANKTVSRLVGRYAVKSDTLGIFKKIVINLIEPAPIYLLLGKFHSLLSRAVIIETKRIEDTAVEILVKPCPGVEEKAYQGQNRIGIFEGIGKHFSSQYAQIEHLQCIHRGGTRFVGIKSYGKNRFPCCGRA